ncbi:hypothetical protein Pyn_27464 [Prunus yedoensis var. nudiflora]|uniref:Uncharacterized protein n=1 Tax=Prunus yedoensis var. nudiflora TaxID=2094558 RepID=A0A314XVN3_PRUYE|nr:hypothetical protein Pyn_27464 [Prunus yedoensis var. nudiflora]
MRGIEVREAHVDAAQPHLPEPDIEVKNHTNINWGGLGVLWLGQESRPKQLEQEAETKNRVAASILDHV